MVGIPTIWSRASRVGAAGQRDHVRRGAARARLDAERVGERPVLAGEPVAVASRARRCGSRGGGRSSACARAGRTRRPGRRSPHSSSSRARAASVTSAANRSRSVPWRSSGPERLVRELAEQLVLAARHREDHLRARARTARSSAASVAVSQACRLTTRSTSVEVGVARCRRARSGARRRRGAGRAPRTPRRRPASGRGRARRPRVRGRGSAGRGARTSGTRDPSRSRRPAAGPSGRRRDDVVDELDEAVDLPELRPALRAHAAVRRLHAERDEERDRLALGQQVPLGAVVRRAGASGRVGGRRRMRGSPRPASTCQSASGSWRSACR